MAAASSGASGRSEPSRQEFQLETWHLALLVLLVVVLCVASFHLGRRVERRSLGPALSPKNSSAGSRDANIEEVGDISRELTFFDTLEGNGPAPLQPPPRAPLAAAPGPARAPIASTASAGAAGPARRSVNEGIMIQVFASKDRAAAEAVRRRLRAKGYTALLVSGGGTHKIRVGPYADRVEAEKQAAILRDQEHLTTWIP